MDDTITLSDLALTHISDCVCPGSFTKGDEWWWLVDPPVDACWYSITYLKPPPNTTKLELYVEVSMFGSIKDTRSIQSSKRK